MPGVKEKPGFADEAEPGHLPGDRKRPDKEEVSHVLAAGRGRKQESEDDGLIPAVEKGQALRLDAVEEQIYVLDFRVHATAEQLTGLRKYLKENGIRFERVSER